MEAELDVDLDQQDGVLGVILPDPFSQFHQGSRFFLNKGFVCPGVKSFRPLGALSQAAVWLQDFLVGPILVFGDVSGDRVRNPAPVAAYPFDSQFEIVGLRQGFDFRQAVEIPGGMTIPIQGLNRAPQQLRGNRVEA